MPPRRKPRYQISDALWGAFFAIVAPEAMTDDYSLIGRVCDRADPVGGCPERMEAEAQGKFFPNFELWGFVWTDAPKRRMTSRARFFTYSEREDMNHPDNTGQAYVWNECPWCRQELPSLGSIRKHQEKLAYEQGDGA